MRIKPNHIAVYLSRRVNLECERNNDIVNAPQNQPFRLRDLLSATLSGLSEHRRFYVCPRIAKKTQHIDIDKFLAYPDWWSSLPKRYTATIITDRFTCLYGIQEWGIAGIIYDDPYNTQYVNHYNFFILSSAGQESFVGAPDPMRSEVGRRFIQFILFIELAKIAVVETSPKDRRHKTPTEKLFNESDQRIFFVDAGWDTTLKSGGFWVHNFWRWQRYGPRFQHVRLRYINDFQKSGYTRRAGKERYDES